MPGMCPVLKNETTLLRRPDSFEEFPRKLTRKLSPEISFWRSLNYKPIGYWYILPRSGIYDYFSLLSRFNVRCLRLNRNQSFLIIIYIKLKFLYNYDFYFPFLSLVWQHALAVSTYRLSPNEAKDDIARLSRQKEKKTYLKRMEIDDIFRHVLVYTWIFK